MNWSDRAKNRSMGWMLLCLSVWLLISPTQGGQAQDSPNLRQEFLKMFARAYFPGRSGQIKLRRIRGYRDIAGKQEIAA